MENLPVENYQFKDFYGLKSIIHDNTLLKHRIPEEKYMNQVKEDNSRSIYIQLVKQINSDFLFLQNSQDRHGSIQLINDLQKCYSNPVIINELYISENLPISEILFDLLLGELMFKGDFEFLISLINLFHILLDVYQNKVVSILLQSEFIESIFSLFNEPLSLEMKNIIFDFLFHILNFSKDSIDKSILYFNDLYQIIFNEVQSIDTHKYVIINHFLKYIEKLVRFQSQFSCLKAKEISQFIDYIFQLPDLNLFFKLVVDILILLIDLCFDAFSLELPCISTLTIIINNWENGTNLCDKALNLRFIEKVASHKIQFEKVSLPTFSSDSILSIVCRLVSQYWGRSKINEIIKLSLKATHSLIENYDESLPIFLDEQIVNCMISIYNSDHIFEIKKLAGLIVFHIIFVKFEVIDSSNYEEIHDIFIDLNDTNIVSQEINEVLEQRFENFSCV